MRVLGKSLLGPVSHRKCFTKLFLPGLEDVFIMDIVHLCVHGHDSHAVRTAAGRASLLPLCGPRDGALSSGCQACLQEPFPVEPPHWPQELVCLSFMVLGMETRALSVLGKYSLQCQVLAPMTTDVKYTVRKCSDLQGPLSAFS